MAAAEKHCLLVVDDEPDLVQSVKDLLRYDYRVLTTTRATEGLKMMAHENVHIVMTDQRMPEMTGVEFLKALKVEHPDTVRLLFTAFADIDVVSDAINEGNVYRYISKPWEPQELKTILRQAVEHYELQAERKKLLSEIQEKNRQLERANRELLQANDLKRGFIRVASHELRTPLTVVLGLSELGCTGKQTTTELKSWLDQIHEHATRLNQRVDQMVKLLQADRFDRVLELAPVDLVGMLKQSAAAVAGFLPQRRLELEIDVPEDLGQVPGDREKLQDSVVQLLINAIRFTPDGGRIRLSARRTEDGGAAIAVRDNGMGIDAASIPHLFEPFFTRLDVSRHCSGTIQFDRRGLGLGLTVVKAFVEMHGGTVQVESQPNQGSTFTIHLPGTQKSA